MTHLLSDLPLPHRFINADEIAYIAYIAYNEALASQSRQTLADLLGDASLLVIDEAQRVPNIGLNLKILVDSFPHAAIIAKCCRAQHITLSVFQAALWYNPRLILTRIRF
ncbi:MAG: hypothetical protein WAW20_06150 [Anaerolineae bacterium]